MQKKKDRYIHKGARVRVATSDGEDNGDNRWHNARAGQVVDTPLDRGVQVLLDGEAFPQFVDWSDVDVEQKPRHTWLELPLNSIRSSRWQYRRHFNPDGLLELAQSIQQHGLINRLLVFATETYPTDEYEIIAGERRLRALCAMAILKVKEAANLQLAVEMVCEANWWQIASVMEELPGTAPCELRDGKAEDFREIVILENLQREDPSPVEEAHALQTLIEKDGYTQAQLAQRLGKSRPYITQRLSLLGLTDDVAQAVDSDEISFTAARSIATLPEAVQPAVAEHVQKLASQEDDSKATSRKVQAMTRQINKFLDPDTWNPSLVDTLTPEWRNGLRLVQHHLRSLDPGRAGQAVIALREQEGSWKSTNYLGKKPLSIASRPSDLAAVLCALTGDGDKATDEFWQDAAQANRWTCASCQFLSTPKPDQVHSAICERWEGESANTCLNFIGHGEPVVIPLGYQLSHAAAGLDLAVEQTGDIDAYLTDIAAYADLQVSACQLRDETAQKADREKTEAHLLELREYWDVRTSGQPWDLGHAQAHGCEHCTHYRPELRDRDLPPCHFAVEPFTNHFSERTVAPDMSALVSPEGTMVPRCREWRGALPPITPLPGFRFPSNRAGRAQVLDWLKRIGIVNNRNSHAGALHGILTWLPYDRGHDDTRAHQDEKMRRWIRDNWGDLGDETVAGLITIAASEAKAMTGFGDTFSLRNPTTGKEETWAGVSWRDISAERTPYGYPEDWPTPWIHESAETSE